MKFLQVSAGRGSEYAFPHWLLSILVGTRGAEFYVITSRNDCIALDTTRRKYKAQGDTNRWVRYSSDEFCRSVIGLIALLHALVGVGWLRFVQIPCKDGSAQRRRLAQLQPRPNV
jgi:hypothetical protein